MSLFSFQPAPFHPTAMPVAPAYRVPVTALLLLVSCGLAIPFHCIRKGLLRALALLLRLVHYPYGYRYVWQDPGIVELRRGPAHAPLKLHQTMAEALDGDASPWRRSLNGADVWRFVLTDSPTR